MGTHRPENRWTPPWWFPGPLFRAYALAAVGTLGYLVRLSRDPWTQQWRLPGRSLLILMIQPLPIAVAFLVLWSALSRWRRFRLSPLWSGWVAAGGLTALSAFDGAYSTIAERHLLEPGQLRFLFLEGAFWASGLLSIRLVVSVILLLGAYAYFLVRGLPRPAGPPPLLLLVASVVLLLGVNAAALSLATGSRRDLYAYAVSANPIPGALELPAHLAITMRPGIRTVVPGLVPQREMKRSVAPPLPARALIEPKVFLVVILDGFRADYLTPERAPNLHLLASRSGVVLNRYYTAYPGDGSFRLFASLRPSSLLGRPVLPAGASPRSPVVSLSAAARLRAARLPEQPEYLSLPPCHLRDVRRCSVRRRRRRSPPLGRRHAERRRLRNRDASGGGPSLRLRPPSLDPLSL